MFHNRKNIRLKRFDYSSPRYYFITLCTDYMDKLFVPKISSKYGHVLPQELIKGSWPEQFHRNTHIIEEKLIELEKKFPCVLDFFCIMPNHVHIIVYLCSQQSSRQSDYYSHGCNEKRRIKIGVIISAFKSWTTRAFGLPVFQPNYYEHVVRDEKALERVRDYVMGNPYAMNLEWKEFER